MSLLEENLDTDKEEKWPYEDRDKDWNFMATIPGTLGLPEADKASEDSPLET